MIIEPWTSSIGAKGMLQQAWFRVKGILVDQRSIRTISRVGGLVGKTVEIDEATRYKADYVRVKIAYRYVMRCQILQKGVWVCICMIFSMN